MGGVRGCDGGEVSVWGRYGGHEGGGMRAGARGRACSRVRVDVGVGVWQRQRRRQAVGCGALRSCQAGQLGQGAGGGNTVACVRRRAHTCSRHVPLHTPTPTLTPHASPCCSQIRDPGPTPPPTRQPPTSQASIRSKEEQRMKPMQSSCSRGRRGGDEEAPAEEGGGRGREGVQRNLPDSARDPLRCITM